MAFSEVIVYIVRYGTGSCVHIMLWHRQMCTYYIMTETSVYVVCYGTDSCVHSSLWHISCVHNKVLQKQRWLQSPQYNIITQTEAAAESTV